MKPFNLQKALAGEPVVTRDGRKINDLHYFYTLTRDCKLYGVINNSIMAWTNEGHWLSTGVEQPEDLFMADKERWANLYWDDISFKAYIGDTIYSTEEEAKENGKSPNYRTTIKLK